MRPEPGAARVAFLEVWLRPESRKERSTRIRTRDSRARRWCRRWGPECPGRRPHCRAEYASSGQSGRRAPADASLRCRVRMREADEFLRYPRAALPAMRAAERFPGGEIDAACSGEGTMFGFRPSEYRWIRQEIRSTRRRL